MSKKKKITLFLALISLLFSLNTVQTTYAKYASKTSNEASLNIARWDISVNNEHIKNTEKLTAEITPNYIDNPNVAAGVIAPGSIGYFDLTIDPENTDVSFSFDISIDDDETSDVTDLRLLKYYIDDENNLIEVDETFTTIHDEIKIDNKVSKTIRIYVIWDDNELTENMDNASDSTIGHDANNKKASIKVNMKFKQII